MKIYTSYQEVIMSKQDPAELTLEQQFSITCFQSQVERMSHEQAQEFLVKLYEQMLMRENMYKSFIKHDWGLGPNS